MSSSRQDAWTEDEDLLLAEVVLRHIREGSTQLAAFEEVGSRLSRTAAACGFRWNSTVRKKYEDAIALAKNNRKQKTKAKRKPPAEQKDDSPEIRMNDVITFLQQFETNDNEMKKEIERLKQEMKEMREDYEKRIAELTEKNRMLKEDYETLISIMDRARQWIGSENDPKDEME